MPNPAEDVQIIEKAVETKDAVVDTHNDLPEKNPQKPQPGLGNYFRVFTFGTKLDYFLIGLSFLTSIGAGIVSSSHENLHGSYLQCAGFSIDESCFRYASSRIC